MQLLSGKQLLGAGGCLYVRVWSSIQASERTVCFIEYVGQCCGVVTQVHSCSLCPRAFTEHVCIHARMSACIHRAVKLYVHVGGIGGIGEMGWVGGEGGQPGPWGWVIYLGCQTGGRSWLIMPQFLLLAPPFPPCLSAVRGSDNSSKCKPPGL